MSQDWTADHITDCLVRARQLLRADRRILGIDNFGTLDLDHAAEVIDAPYAQNAALEGHAALKRHYPRFSWMLRYIA